MRSSRHIRGFSLVEVCLALGIAAFCLLALFSLLPLGINSNQTSVEMTRAAGIANTVLTDLVAATDTATQSSTYQVPLPAAGQTVAQATSTFFVREDGSAYSAAKSGQREIEATDLAADARYRVSVDLAWADSKKMVLWSRIRVSWPPVTKLNLPNAVPPTIRPAGLVDLGGSVNRLH